jgi:hypothetical protein
MVLSGQRPLKNDEGSRFPNPLLCHPEGAIVTEGSRFVDTNDFYGGKRDSSLLSVAQNDTTPFMSS